MWRRLPLYRVFISVFAVLIAVSELYCFVIYCDLFCYIVNMENVAVSPQKRNMKGKVVHSGQRRLIINVYKDKKRMFPHMKYNEIMNLVATTCGVGRRTVVGTIAEYRRTGSITLPLKKRAKPDMMQKLSDEDIYKIRKHIHAF